MKVLLALILVVFAGCGKESASSQTRTVSESTIAENKPEMVTVTCDHVPTCWKPCIADFEACRSACAPGELCPGICMRTEIACMQKEVTVDKELTDVEIGKHCYQEDGVRICPGS